MLACQLEQHGSEGRCLVAVVALADDMGAAKAIDGVRAEMAANHHRRLLSVLIESILDEVDELAPDLSSWATSFHRCYVDRGLAASHHASHDEVGPRFGRTLGQTAAVARAQS